MITGLHHIVLFCRDTDAARAWYQRAGFTYKRGHHGMHWVALGDAEVMLHPLDGEPVAGAGHPRPVLHAAVKDIDAVFAHMVGQGLTPIDHQRPGAKLDGPVTRPWGDREFEIQDVDGQWWAFTGA